MRGSNLSSEQVEGRRSHARFGCRAASANTPVPVGEVQQLVRHARQQGVSANTDETIEGLRHLTPWRRQMHSGERSPRFLQAKTDRTNCPRPEHNVATGAARVGADAAPWLSTIGSEKRRDRRDWRGSREPDAIRQRTLRRQPGRRRPEIRRPSKTQQMPEVRLTGIFDVVAPGPPSGWYCGSPASKSPLRNMERRQSPRHGCNRLNERPAGSTASARRDNRQLAETPKHATPDPLSSAHEHPHGPRISATARCGSSDDQPWHLNHRQTCCRPRADAFEGVMENGCLFR